MASDVNNHIISCIERLDKTIHRYYKSFNLGAKYLNDDRIGKFEEYCAENGIEDDHLKEELGIEWDETPLVDFDDEFPFVEPPENDDDKKKQIHEFLKECKANPHRRFDRIPQRFEKSQFDEIEEKSIDKVSEIHKKNCPKIWNEGIETEQDLLRILAVGHQNRNFPLLQYLFDVYNYDRIQRHKKDPKNCLEVADWGKECVFLTQFGEKIQNGIIAALISCNKRCTPKLLFNPVHTINDSVEQITKYIYSVHLFISNLLQKEDRTAKEEIVPFQLDLVIVSGEAASNNNAEEKKDDVYMDHVGDIEKKLNNNNLKYFQCELNPSNSEDEKLIAKSRPFEELLERWMNAIKAKSEEECLRNKRFILCIDRRKSKNDEETPDDIFFYEPPKGPYTQDIPKNAPAEWYVSASRTCIIPPMEYDEDDATGNNKAKQADKDQKKRPDVNKDMNIGATSHCKGAILTVSFHVFASDEIKCYLYYNGQCIRYIPNETRTLFRIIFSMKYGNNKEYLDDDDELDGFMAAMGTKLVDLAFADFLSVYSCDYKNCKK